MACPSRTVLALTVALLAAPMLDAVVGGSLAFADATEASDIGVGTQLMAVQDVSLHKAELIKGSRVSVTKLLLRGGQLDGVSVALADGHIVKLAMKTLRSFFQVVED